MEDLPQPPSPQIVMLIGMGAAAEDVEWEGVCGGMFAGVDWLCGGVFFLFGFSMVFVVIVL
jgi:hypothetical protein